MGEGYFVQIDLDRLAEDLSLAEGRPLSADEAGAWLVRVGFVPSAPGWLGTRRSMALLSPSEIICAEPFA